MVDGRPENWEEMLPHAAFLLRCAPMAVLGGLRPYEVVQRLKPRLLGAVRGAQPVGAVTTNQYVADLFERPRDTYSGVRRTTLETIER